MAQYVNGITLDGSVRDPKDLSDLETFALTLYGEARGEPIAGKVAVANVILNRWHTGYRHKMNVKDVCLDKWQFSCWNKNDPNRDKMLSLDMEDPALCECRVIAHLGISDLLQNNIGTSRHYKVTTVAANWAEGHDPDYAIGHHEFFEGIA